MKSKTTASKISNIIITILMICLGVYRCFTAPIERLLSGRCHLDHIVECFFDICTDNIFNFVICGLIIFALYSKHPKRYLLISTGLLWIKSSLYLFGERINASFSGGSDFFDFMHIRLNGYFYLSLFIIILTIYFFEKQNKNILPHLRFSMIIPFVLLVVVLILRMNNYEKPNTNMLDDRIVEYFSNSKYNVLIALREFTNTVNKTVEVIKFIAFTLIIVKISALFRPKADAENTSNDERSE